MAAACAHMAPSTSGFPKKPEAATLSSAHDASTSTKAF